MKTNTRKQQSIPNGESIKNTKSRVFSLPEMAAIAIGFSVAGVAADLASDRLNDSFPNDDNTPAHIVQIEVGQPDLPEPIVVPVRHN